MRPGVRAEVVRQLGRILQRCVHRFGDQLAHVGQRLDLAVGRVNAVLEGPHIGAFDHAGQSAARFGCGRTGLLRDGFRQRGEFGRGGDGGLYVAFDDAAVRAGTLQRGGVDRLFFRQCAGARRYGRSAFGGSGLDGSCGCGCDSGCCCGSSSGGNPGFRLREQRLLRPDGTLRCFHPRCRLPLRWSAPEFRRRRRKKRPIRCRPPGPPLRTKPYLSRRRKGCRPRRLCRPFSFSFRSGYSFRRTVPV